MPKPTLTHTRENRIIDEVEVLGMAKEEEDCEREIFVLIGFGGRKVGVPLAQLEVALGASATREAVDDWRWWVASQPQG